MLYVDLVAKHARSKQAKISTVLVGITGALSFAVATTFVALGGGVLQASAWFLGLAASPIAALVVGLGWADQLATKDFARVFEAQMKLNAVYLVGTVLAWVVAVSRAPLSQSGIGLVAATLVAVASWTLLAEIFAIVTWDRMLRRHGQENR